MEKPSKGRNLAVTKDGTKYNKLSRPDDLPVPIPKHTSAAPPMDSAKRKLEELDPSKEITNEEPYTKRARPSELLTQEEYDVTTASTPKREPIINTRKSIKPKMPTRNEKYGQAQGIGSGLDDWDDGNATDSSTNEAMRQEADAIPVLITAPAAEVSEDDTDETQYNDGFADPRSIFKDGVCMAARSDSPLPPTNTSEDDGSIVSPDIPPQAAYHAMLMKQLKCLRESMGENPPPDALERLNASSKTLTEFARLHRPAVIKWSPILKYTYPTPAQLSQMSQAAILNLIAAVIECLKPDRNITPQLSCWIWGIFGRLGERGTLHADDDYTVRELGKAAVAIRLSYLGFEVEGPSLNLDEREMLIDNGYESDVGWESEQHNSDDSQIDEEDGKILEVVDQDTAAGTERSDVTSNAIQLRDPHTQSTLTVPKSDSASEDGEIPDNGPSAIIDSIELAKARLLSRLDSAPPKPERGSNISPRITKSQRKLKKLRARKKAETKQGRPRSEAGTHPNHPSHGSYTSNHFSYDHFASTTPQSEARRSVSTTHTTGNTSRDTQRRRNTSSIEPSPDPLRVRRNTSSVETSPGPYRRLRRASTPAERTFPSRAEAEASRHESKEDAVPQLDGADEPHDLTVTDGGDNLMMDPEPEAKIEDLKVSQGKPQKVVGECTMAVEKVPNLNTLATLDMIITVVGERYGQRDLLPARESWDAVET